ncbi:MAG: PilT/PilU family type 4a pilus ATPase, partial [Candidatus Rokubacteria bacterium]|nr:PilT/PilU family type 4a pilus ATPase [Candidatus Rokubacteria bacterium]
MTEAPVVKLEEVLRLAIEMNATDIHVQVGLPPMFRVRGKLVAHESDALTAEQCEALVFSIMSEDQKKTFSERLDCDFSYGVPGLARFRINVFRQRASVAAAFRRIPYQIPALEQLGLPPGVLDLLKLKRGLVLVTGATGQGKSTTLASLLDRMNQERQLHIVTLEDPVEFSHPHKMATFNQREMGSDFDTFSSGLRAALRQAPKIILVGEMRDRETVEIGLSAAETGHLVLSTLHTVDAGQTINRILGMFST